MVLILAVFALFVPVPVLGEPTTRDLAIDTSQFDFAPGRVTVNRGDTVRVTLTASDVVHGFYLDGYDIDVRVEPGNPETVEFVADRPGKFRYRCSVACGSLHPFMIGELVIRPNVPFWRSVAAATLLAIGTVLLARRRVPV